MENKITDITTDVHFLNNVVTHLFDNGMKLTNLSRSEIRFLFLNRNLLSASINNIISAIMLGDLSLVEKNK